MTDAVQLVCFERVRCLECGVTYAKPCGGTTTRRNPGCPRCGYVGWIAAALPLGLDLDPDARRSYADLRLHRRPR